MTDYMLTGKPIIKLSTTNDDREMFYEESIFEKISVKSRKQLLERIEEIISNNSAYEKYSRVSRDMAPIFHSFRNFGNSQRIIDGIRKGNLQEFLFK